MPRVRRPRKIKVWTEKARKALADAERLGDTPQGNTELVAAINLIGHIVQTREDDDQRNLGVDLERLAFDLEGTIDPLDLLDDDDDDY